jgi:hypothetical protein
MCVVVVCDVRGSSGIISRIIGCFMENGRREAERGGKYEEN